MWVDALLGSVGLQRKPKRAPFQRQLFKGAEVSRLTADWAFTPITSANKEIQSDLIGLRGRARDLARNDRFATRFLGLLEENVIGPQGIRLQAQVTRPDERTYDLAINRTIERAWMDWCRKGVCTADGRLSMRALQRMLVRTWAMDGEIVLRCLEGFDNDWGFAVQLIDSDQLDERLSRPAEGATNAVRMGVEVNQWERPVRYHIWRHHPRESDRSFNEHLVVEADQILHTYLPLRAHQARGVTWFAPVLIDTHMLAGYMEAELVAARVAAAKSGFFLLDPEAEPDPDDPDSQFEDTEIEVEPGLIDIAPPGVKDFKAYDPQHPTAQFEAFQKSIVRNISTGLRTSYAMLAGDLREVNYSSIRAGVLADRDVYRILQGILAEEILQPVYDRWLRWAITTGQHQLPMRNMAGWRQHKWQPRGWQWVDPKNDAEAGMLGVNAGVNSLTRIAAEQGADLEEVLQERKKEIELAAELGVPISIGGNANGQASAPKHEAADDEGDPGGDDGDGGGGGGGEGGSRNRLLELADHHPSRNGRH